MNRCNCLVFVAVLAVGLSSSCAYYNTFYNTKKLYREAEKAREKRQGDKPTSAELQAYDKTIEKASKVLTNYPDSKYVDDALMILGECFYYKQEYLKARRKFEELLTLFPKSDYVEKARLWLAKSNIALRDFANAEVTLREILDASKKKDIREEAELLLGDLYFAEQAYQAAVEAYRRAASYGGREKRALAHYRLGEALLEADQSEEAVDAFTQAWRLTKDRRLENDALFERGVALKFAGHYEEAIQVFTRLLKDDTFKDRYPEAKLQVADCLREKGDIEEAIERYKTVTEDHKRTWASAEAHYRLGLIYEEDLRDFESAKTHYDRVRPEYSASEWAAEATQRSRDIAALLRLRGTIAQMERQSAPVPGSPKPKEGKKPLLEEMEPELLTRRANEPISKPNRTIPDTADIGQEEDKLLLVGRNARLQKQTPPAATPAKTAELSETQKDQLVKSKMQLAELYLLQYSQVDSAMRQYMDIVENYPDHPLAPRALYAIAYSLRTFVSDTALADSTLRYLIQRYPDTPQAQAAARQLGLPVEAKSKAETLFREAEAELFDRQRPNRALELYSRVVERYPDSDYAAKALYAMAYIHENQVRDPQAALADYRKLAQEYPQSPYGKEAAKRVQAVERAQKAALAAAEAGTAVGDGAEPTERVAGGQAESESSQISQPGRRGRRPSLREHLKKLGKGVSSERRVP